MLLASRGLSLTALTALLACLGSSAFSVATWLPGHVAHAQMATFEVASVRENRQSRETRSGVTMRTLPGGRFEARNVTVRLLILRNYGLRGFQLVGGPEWMETERFDIVAKAPSSASERQTTEMVRNLLANRFGLVARREQRRLPAYSLKLAQRPQRLGPGLRRVPPDCEAFLAAAAAAAGTAVSGSESTQPACEGRLSFGPGMISTRGGSLAFLLTRLTEETGRPVTDRTGLVGLYDVDLTWTPDPGMSNSPMSRFPSTDNTGRSIFTAVREELGLELEPVVETIDVLVIENLERPTPD